MQKYPDNETTIIQTSLLKRIHQSYDLISEYKLSLEGFEMVLPEFKIGF